MSDRFRFVVDRTAALAGVRIERPDAERLLRRLTELDLALLPAVGAVARVAAYVLRDGEASFRLFFGQEYGDYLLRVLVDAAEGLEGAPTTPPPDPLDRR
jgi:sarcosine oxidase gamma subunit